MTKYQLLFIFIIPNFLVAQIPLAEIEGRLSHYLPTDSLSLHIGKNAGGNSTIGGNTFVGTDAGSRNEASFNSFFDARAGANNTGPTFNNPDGSENSFFGYYAGFKNTWGGGNSYFGANAGNALKGNKNTIIGTRSGAKINGSSNVILDYEAGPQDPINGSEVEINDRLYVNNTHSPSPLIYGEFDNKILRIYDRLDTENGTIFMRNLGNTDTNQGLKWGESNNDPAFGLTYDGEGTKVENRMHFQEYVDGGPGKIITIKANGNVGIGLENPTAALHNNEFMQLEPRSNAPGCLSSSDEGRIYYDSTLKKVRACIAFRSGMVSHGWVDLH